MKRNIIVVIIFGLTIFIAGTFFYFWWLGKQNEQAKMLLETTLPTSAVPTPEVTPEVVPPSSTPPPSLPPPKSSPQVVNVVQTVYPGKYEPSVVVVKVGIQVVIRMTTTQREHLNRVSILPWVKQSNTVLPGKITEVIFTPDRIGDFQIRNIGHGFTGTLRVVE